MASRHEFDRNPTRVARVSHHPRDELEATSTALSTANRLARVGAAGGPAKTRDRLVIEEGLLKATL
jgi:hypothetical protein